MLVNGYQIREALKRWTLRRDSLSAQFPEVLVKFPRDLVATPFEVSDALYKVEASIARLQEAQQVYNSKVTAKLSTGGTETISFAVKYMGGLGRLEKMWRAAGVARKRQAYEETLTVRDPSKEHAYRQVSYQEATDKATALSREIGTLKVAVAEANAQQIDLDLDQALLEG